MAEPTTRSTGRPDPARITLPRSPSSVAEARRFIAARAAAWSFSEPAREQLVLIGSELVTNAVLQARTELVLTLELRRDRVRISVRDHSQAPATLRHYRADALTGRGLGVVAALSDNWGVSAAADGKVVWAELAANGDHVPAPRPPDLRQARDDAGTPGPLADLVDQLYRRFRGQRDSYRDVVAAAQARGEPTVELETAARPGSAAMARSYLALLEQADELCRTGLLLTPEPPPHVKALRRWFVEQMAAQLLDGTPPPHPTSRHSGRGGQGSRQPP